MKTYYLLWNIFSTNGIYVDDELYCWYDDFKHEWALMYEI